MRPSAAGATRCGCRTRRRSPDAPPSVAGRQQALEQGVRPAGQFVAEGFRLRELVFAEDGAVGQLALVVDSQREPAVVGGLPFERDRAFGFDLDGGLARQLGDEIEQACGGGDRGWRGRRPAAIEDQGCGCRAGRLAGRGAWTDCRVERSSSSSSPLRRVSGVIARGHIARGQVLPFAFTAGSGLAFCPLFPLRSSRGLACILMRAMPSVASSSALPQGKRGKRQDLTPPAGQKARPDPTY